MKIVAANYADSLRGSGSADTAEDAARDSMRAELRCLFGDAEEQLPAELAALAERLARAEAGPAFGA